LEKVLNLNLKFRNLEMQKNNLFGNQKSSPTAKKLDSSVLFTLQNTSRSNNLNNIFSYTTKILPKLALVRSLPYLGLADCQPSSPYKTHYMYGSMNKLKYQVFSDSKVSE
jgi:hypothetical protein